MIAPRFPLTVHFEEDGSRMELEQNQLASTLEWFDSEDPSQAAHVFDRDGREVVLRVLGLEVVVCQLR